MRVVDRRPLHTVENEVDNVMKRRHVARVRAGTGSLRGWLLSVTVVLATLQSSFAGEPQITEAVINAPIATIWDAFTTADGYRQLGVAQADVDLRIGGRIRTHHDANGRLGDSQSIEQEILAYDPQRMLAVRVVQAPADLPHREALLKSWTVIYFSSIAGATTHVRMVALGYEDDATAKALRTSIEQGNRQALDLLVKRYRPNCAHCERTP
jgi:uncharacterized protein YndB with AHSA1/START domain